MAESRSGAPCSASREPRTNELRQWELKELQEIERILAALSAEIAPYAESLKDNVSILGELDFIFAKGIVSLGDLF